MTDSNMKLEFLRFPTAAAKGYQSTIKKCQQINLILQKTESRIRSTEKEDNPDQGLQINALISRQIEDIQVLQKSLGEIQQNIEDLRAVAKEFSIVVYGSKFAGKSTLMEILTHGNGKTIGKGTKRTTREVRTYYWNGLKITDISGFDFSDNSANEAVKKADCILFLMPNDALLSEEAKNFAHLKSFGKPILGIINVRKILNFKQRDSILQDLKKTLPTAQTAIEDFKKFALQYKQDWSNVKFLPTHLLAAFYSRIDRVNDDEIYNASNFVEVENLILGKIITDGEFLHIKNFVDNVSVPLHNILQNLFKHNGNAFQESEIWAEQSKKILTWRKTFFENAKVELQNLFKELSESLEHEIKTFSEYNYGTENINETWHAKMHKLGYIERYQELLEDFLQECKDKFPKLIDDFTQELENSLEFNTQTHLQLKDKKIFGDYSDIVLPSLLKLIPEMNWTKNASNNDAGAMFYQVFFETKAAANVEKESLIKQLTKTSFKVLGDINDNARDILNKQILGKVDNFSKLLESYSYTLVNLGEAQGEMAESLLSEYEELNASLLKEAVNCKGAGSIDGIKVTMRIPGETFAVIADKAEVDTDKISSLFSENFLIINPQNCWYNTMKKVLECEFDLDEYSLNSTKSDDKTYSVTPKEKIPDTRVKLAQQISPYPIILR